MYPKYAVYILYIRQQKKYQKDESFTCALLGTRGKKQPPFLKHSIYQAASVSTVTCSQPCEKTETLTLYKLENSLSWSSGFITCERDGVLQIVIYLTRMLSKDDIFP